jgi:predicted ester cyclase
MLECAAAAMLAAARQLPGRKRQKEGFMPDAEQNKEVVRRCYTAAAAGDRAALDEILDPGFVIHAPEDHHGVDGLLAMLEPVKAGLGELKVTIDAQFADGDYVTTRFTARGTHDGHLFGTPPTGRDVSLSGITISRCAGGRIAEEWELVDALGMLGQIGALPAPAGV